MRNSEPSSAFAARSYSRRSSVSQTITPSPVDGSYDLMTPCTACSQPALTTLPLLMQPVHTETRFGAPLTRARTFWMFGLHRRFVRRWLWETDMPHDGCLPHTSQ